MNAAKTDNAIAYLSTAEMIEVDRAMIEDYHIELIQMMENAGRNLAHLARTRFLDGDPRRKRVLVLAGSGGNGGGALVAARRLHNWGGDIIVALGQSPDAMTPLAMKQLDILQRMGVMSTGAPADLPQLEAITHEGSVNLILDGLIGYGLKGTPAGLIGGLIRFANGSESPILALDTPSGIDATSGAVHDPAIRAAATMTLALPKQGLRASGAAEHIGELYLADISVPPGLYGQPPLNKTVGPLFAEDELVRIA